MKQSDRQRMIKIIETGRRLLDYVKAQNITEADIEQSYAVQWTITTPLYNIGEHTYQLSKEMKSKYPDVPWSQIVLSINTTTLTGISSVLWFLMSLKNT